MPDKPNDVLEKAQCCKCEARIRHFANVGPYCGEHYPGDVIPKGYMWVPLNGPLSDSEEEEWDWIEAPHRTWLLDKQRSIDAEQ